MKARDIPASEGDVTDTRAERPRKIVHIDMDAFYASVEQRDHPELRGKPVAVGGERERGVVAAASYEARAFGVRSAMPSVTARRKCPALIFVKPRFDAYRAISQQIRAIFLDYTPLVEPLSLDEAYLDVTHNLKGIETATKIAQEIRRRIFEETGLTASAGVSYNKFLAKLASDHRKPNGLFVIAPGQGAAFVETMPVGKFHGVGPATTAKMNTMGIHTGLDLRAQSLEFLSARFGKAGAHYYWISRGVDSRPVQANRARKSIGAEITFSSDLADLDAMQSALAPILDRVWRQSQTVGVVARTFTLKVKFADFEIVTRSRTASAGLRAKEEIECVSLDLLRGLFPLRKSVRLLGASLSSFVDEAERRDAPQLTLAL